MRSALSYSLAPWLLLTFFCSTPRSTVAATTQPVDSAVQMWIGKLGSDDEAQRYAGETNLTEAGKRALPALHIAATDSQPEVRTRARRIMRKIQLFLQPGVPDAALSIAADYLRAETSERRKMQLNRLFQLQPQPNAILTRLVPLEPDDELRHQILYALGTGYRDDVGRILTDDEDPEALFTLLNGASEMWGQSEAADDATAAYLSGNLEDKIAQYTAEQINGDAVAKEHSAAHLCFLYRVCGKSSEAMQAARASGEQPLIFLILQDQGDWAAAAKEPDDRWHDPMLTAAFRAAFQRLAGNPEQAVSTMQAMLKSAAPDGDDNYSPSKLFLMNDLPERGISLLENRHPAAAFSMRVARGEIAEALEIATKYETHPQDGRTLVQLRDDLRRTLGELPEPATQPVESANAPASPEWLQAVDHLKHHQDQLAADEFGEMWERDHTHFDRLYLQGYAMNSAGQTERGLGMMKTAEMIPLGDPMRRRQLAVQLMAADLEDVAEQQLDLALRGGGDFDDVGFSEIYNTRMQLAIVHKQWAAAADAADRLCMITLSPRLQWLNPVRFLTAPALAHLLKARLARERGDLSTAMRELDVYQHYLPAESDMVLEWTPALDAMGEHGKADQIFDGVYGKIRALCDQYPQSVAYQNQLAWMSACCGRQLDAALQAAEAAVRMKPNDWQLLDTLAEVHFRRGDRIKATGIEQQAIAVKKDPYLDRQLKRFESAAVPSTTQPGIAPE